MGPIRWEDPPPRNRVAGPGRSKGFAQRNWEVIGEALTRRPGEWAVIVTVPTASTAGTIALAIRRGRYTRMGPGPFEAVGRLVDGEHRVYARFVGGDAGGTS